MIAKRVKRGKGGDFGRLGAYILDPKKVAGSETGEWRRMADYILDTAGGGARSAAVRITNCHSDDIEWVIREIEATQAENVRAKGDRTYHLVVSFPPGERPSPAQLIDIEDELVKAIALQAHQRLSAVHTDTAHLHMHIAINQVHPQTHACVEPWYDQPKLMAACRKLEIKHGLVRTHAVEASKSRDLKRGPARRARPRGESKQDSSARPETGPRPEMPAAVEEPTRRPGEAISQRAEAMAIHGGHVSLLAWLTGEIQAPLMEAIGKASSWKEVHAALAVYGLTTTPRGAGLVIVEETGKLRVKASSVDRRLSMKALTQRFGAFVAPAYQPDADGAAQRSNYRRQALHKGQDVDRLWSDYQRRRAASIAARERAMGVIGQRHRLRREAAFHAHRVGRGGIAGTHALSRSGKQSELAALDLGLQLKLKKWRDEAKTERETARRAHDLPSWVSYLRECAAGGDADALAVLRRQEAKFRKAADAEAAKDPTAEARMAVLQEFKPSVGANGEVLYRLRDGGVVADRATGLCIDKQSPFALLLQIALFKPKYPGQALQLGGNAAFHEALIQMAAAEGIEIQFADPRHESARKDLKAIHDRGGPDAAVLRFVAERNAASDPADAGRRFTFWDASRPREAVFAGLVTLKDGSKAALLQCDRNIAVKLVADEAAIAALGLGAAVVVDADGSIAAKPPKRRWGWMGR